MRQGPGDDDDYFEDESYPCLDDDEDDEYPWEGDSDYLEEDVW